VARRIRAARGSKSRLEEPKMLKWSIGSFVVAVLTGVYGFQQGLGETEPLMGLCRMVCVGFVFLTILFALGHFDNNAEEA
jgi:hypothetical protein